MDLRRYIVASLRQYRRSHLPVMLGVAVATAVLTGALLVGDSVRGSLRDLTLQRLGRIDQAIVATQPFRAELAGELAAEPKLQEVFAGADAAFLLRGSLSSGSGDERKYAGGVSIVGVTKNFTDHREADWASGLEDDAVALTEPLANELGVGQGDEVVLRLPALDAVPADSPLGEKTDTTIGKRLTVARVLPPRGLARFSLTPSQAEPRNAFVPIATVQQVIDQPGKANAILVDRRESGQFSSVEEEERLTKLLRPKLADYGLSVEELPTGAVQVESKQLVLPDAAVETIDKTFPGATRQPVVTYLANTIRAGDQSISYSTVAGVDSLAGLGPLLDENGEPIVLADDEIVLNDHAAERLGAAVDDTVTITYYEPESTHGELVEAEPLKLRLKAIVPLRKPDGQPAAAADPRLTPVLEGVTDAESIGDWDLPFELVQPIVQADEDYWDDHSTTPKAFVSFDLAARLWSTRWGTVSLVRVSGDGLNRAAVASRLEESLEPAAMGFNFLPVKRQGLMASSGTTPFDGLFFGFSLFLIASSVMLIALLFGLGIESRSKEVGLLSAVGWDAPRVRGVLVGEALRVAAAGVAIGVPAGILYAGVMILGLTTWWVEAIVAPFLRLHVTWPSLAIGAVMGLVVSWLTIRLVVRRLLKVPARGLLAGQTTVTTTTVDRRRQWSTYLLSTLLLAAIVMSAFAATQSGEAQAGMFFGGGAALLAALVLLARQTLVRQGIHAPAPLPFRLWSLAWRNVARNPGRSVLTLALVGAASFLILAISAFRLGPTDEGTGGFVLVAQSDQPIHYDLNTAEGRLELAFREDEEALLDQFNVYQLRLHDGEDASCLNLYQTRQPRILGVPDKLIERGGFTFAATFAPPQPKGSNLASWQTLRADHSAIRNPQSAFPIPVLLDFNTATYSLEYRTVGDTLEINDEAGQPVDVEFAGLFKNSILQGDLLMGERDFLKLYPSASGSRFFLIEPKNAKAAGDTDKLAAMLEARLGDYGFDTERADRRLARFLAVQNTYLSTFQSLGALGLLLGAVGVAVVQLRNLAERRGELALLRASGFAPLRLRTLVLRENLLLLGGGLAIGAVAATLALMPQAIAAVGSAGGARLPWSTTGALLAAILAIGLAVGAAATRAALRASIIPALRGD